MFVVAAYPSILLFLMDGMIKDHKDLEEVCNLIIPSSDILWKFLYVYFLIILAQYSAHLPPVLFCWCVKGGSKCAGIALAKYGEIFRPDCKSFLTRESEEAGTASKSDMDARHLVACWGEWPCTPFSPPGNTGTDQHLKAVQAMERERERQRASKALLLQMLIIHEAGKNAGGILILGQMAALMTLRLWQLDHLATLKEVVYVYAQLWDDRKFEMYWAALWKDASSLLGLLNSVSQFLWQI